MKNILIIFAALLLLACSAARSSSPINTQPDKQAKTATVLPNASPALRPTLRPTPRSNDGLPGIHVDQLPAEARDTLRLIEQGGPFPYDQDGAIFQNRERLLPRQPRGYYHEYTVITPGERDRGARRIVTGQSGEIYYTDDHYDSFKRVEQ